MKRFLQSNLIGLLVGFISASPFAYAGISLTSSASGIISGTTSISGGATTEVCYNQAGVIKCGDAGFVYVEGTDLGTIGALIGVNALQAGTTVTAGTATTSANATMSGSSATSNFLNVTGTLPGTLSAATYGVYIDVTADNDAQPQSALYVRLGGVNGGGTDPWALRVSNGATTNGIFCADDNGTCVVNIQDGARSGVFSSQGFWLGGFSTATVEFGIAASTNTEANIQTTSTTTFSAWQVLDSTGNASASFVAYGSAMGTSNLGVTNNQAVSVLANGGSLSSLKVFTLTDDPLYLGRLDLQRFQIGPTKTLADNTITTFAAQTLGNDTGGGGTLHYCVYAADATTAGLECGNVDFAGVDVTAGAGGEVCPTPTKHGTPLQALSGSTLTVTFAGSTGTDLCNIRVTADTNIATPVSLWITWSAPYSGRVLAAQ